MYRPRGPRTLLLAVVLALSALLTGFTPVLADAPPGPFFNGFESSTSGWFDAANGGSGSIVRTSSGAPSTGYASGLASATGAWHARISSTACLVPAPCVGPNTRWGGYNQTFPIGGYRTYVSIYLDAGWAATHADARFDYISAINNAAGTHLRDFTFNAGTNLATDTSPAGFYVNASTNTFRQSSFPQNTCPAPSTAPNTCRTPAHITTSGWYTFRHTFRAESGSLAVDMDILDASGGTVKSWTIYSGDAMATVGGNRYGWFANEEIPQLPIDDSERTGLELALTPASALNPAGTRHTVTATATSTEPNRPAPGPGVPVEFTVISGPNEGQSSEPGNTGCGSMDCTTDSAGNVSWTYLSNGATGTDTIEACFEARPPIVQRTGDDPRTCATATKTWGSSTGKVTGGGQIQGDPLFGAGGALLSLPAIVPSLAGSGAQATFGFVVQSTGTPKGNLEYQDKPAGVRIKATSITSLLIAEGPCGDGTRAVFEGNAQVTRPTGTTTEDFTVTVDDCGEPGTTDTFEISTTGGYSNGPETLIGGNIQIHR